MLVAKAMCVVMELGAIRVAAGIWQICANIQKLCSFQPGSSGDHLLKKPDVLVGRCETRQLRLLRR